MAVRLPKSERSKKARDDLELYSRMLRGGNVHGCLVIEREWEIDGLPPNVVTALLYDVGEGKTLLKAMDDLGM